MSQWDFGTSEGESNGSGFPGAGFYADGFDNGFDEGFSPISFERDPYERDLYGRELYGREPYERDLYEPDAHEWDPPTREFWPPGLPGHGHTMPPRRPGSLRWLVPAVIVVVAVCAGAGVVLLSGAGHTAAPGASGASGASATAGRPPAVTQPAAGATLAPLTPAQAQRVVASYTTANNAANAQRSDTLLAAIETGSSYAIDAGIYRVQLAEGAAPYPAFGPQQGVQYYIPSRETAYPHWFVVQVANADLASPRTVTGTEYLVFTQSGPGAPWLNAIEPYVVQGVVVPQIAIGGDGLATAVPVSPAASSLAVSPAQLEQLTASSLDGGQTGPPNPGNLADGVDQAFWRKQVPAASITDQHTPGAGPLFGLATTDGGALFFYTDAAELTLTAPAGEVLHLTVPGFYSPGQALTTAGIGYLEQFATYVPPRGESGLRVVADYSGITARN